jgi:hypothetical protein
VSNRVQAKGLTEQGKDEKPQVATTTPVRPFKAVARVQIPLGPQGLWLIIASTCLCWSLGLAADLSNPMVRGRFPGALLKRYRRRPASSQVDCFSAPFIDNIQIRFEILRCDLYDLRV